MIIQASLEYSLILFPLILGTYLSYRVLHLTDMTVEGSFILGAALFARLLSEGISPSLCLFIAVLGGSFTGLSVAFIQKENKIPPLVASILGIFMLYSLNFQVMGRPNISLLSYETGIGTFVQKNPFLGWSCLLGAMILLGVSLRGLLMSSLGLFLKTFGEKANLIEKLGRNPEFYRRLGLSISNGLAALSGALMAQMNGYADLNMGLGVALTSIGAVVIGQQFMIRFVLNPTRAQEILSCFGGIFLYAFSLNMFLWVGIDPVHLKLVLGLMLIMFLRNA